MSRVHEVKAEFVEFIPEHIEGGTLYVSMTYATATHLCCCGCGSRVVTPISPTDWVFTFDGDSVSLDPSIGNWSFPCESHYWIKRNKVRWASTWGRDKIERGRKADQSHKETYFGNEKERKKKRFWFW